MTPTSQIVITEEYLRELKESYRQVAFPRGGAKTIRSRDDQNRALVARGGFRCCQHLLEEMQRARAMARKARI